MKRALAFLIAGTILAAVPVPARASDFAIDTSKMDSMKSDMEHTQRDLKRSQSSAESKRWEVEKKVKRAGILHHDGATHYAEPYVGHSETKKVHLRECEWAEKIAESNRVFFKTYEEAAGKGYEACEVCKPDSVTPEEAASAGAGTATPPAQASAPFVGHRVTRKLHRAACEWAKKISAENRVGFATWKEARAAGYVACGKCKPDVEEVSGSAMDAHFVGNRNSKKLHRAGCEFVKKISPSNRAGFKSWKEAEAAGFTACGGCRPDAAETPAAGTEKAKGGTGEGGAGE